MSNLYRYHLITSLADCFFLLGAYEQNYAFTHRVIEHGLSYKITTTFLISPSKMIEVLRLKQAAELLSAQNLKQLAIRLHHLLKQIEKNAYKQNTD